MIVQRKKAFKTMKVSFYLQFDMKNSRSEDCNLQLKCNFIKKKKQLKNDFLIIHHIHINAQIQMVYIVCAYECIFHT